MGKEILVLIIFLIVILPAMVAAKSALFDSADQIFESDALACPDYLTPQWREHCERTHVVVDTTMDVIEVVDSIPSQEIRKIVSNNP